MHQTLLDHYKAIESSSQDMLASAMAADWQQVQACERACGALIARLRGATDRLGLSADQRQEKNRIMMRILALDAQIRCLAEPWQARYEQHYTGRRPGAGLQ